MTHNWPLSDHRTPEQLAQDKAAVREQVASLTAPNGDATAKQNADRVLERIRKRQLEAPDGQSTRFVRFTPASGGGSVLVAENQLMVDASAAQLAEFGSLLAGYSPADRVGRSSRRRTRVFRAGGKALEAVLRDAKRIRDEKKVQASVNSIVPLGYVIKGNSYPGRTVAPGAFAANGGGAPVRVAIIDTGLTAVPRTDSWDTGVVRNGTDPVNVLAPMDRIDWFAGHGTFAAGIVRQIAPDCEVVVYRFTSTDGLGTDEAAADMLIQAADDAAGGRLIINASFGAPAVDGVPPLAMQEAARYVNDTYPNALIIASAGNDGLDLPHFPAAYPFPRVKAVGALNSDLSAASFSNHGSWVDCSTVGVGIVSTFVEGKLPPEDNLGTDILFPGDSWATWSGTSFTAPQISGAVACLCGENGALAPQAAFDQLITGQPTLAGYGKVVHLLPGTPTV